MSIQLETSLPGKMLLLLVSLLSCSCMLAESNRSYNYVSLTCQTDIGSERHPQWWFNRTQLAESWCYNHIASSSDGSISVTVTPKCEGKVSYSAAGVTDNEKSIPHKPLGNHNKIIILIASNYNY